MKAFLSCIVVCVLQDFSDSYGQKWTSQFWIWPLKIKGLDGWVDFGLRLAILRLFTRFFQVANKYLKY